MLRSIFLALSLLVSVSAHAASERGEPPRPDACPLPATSVVLSQANAATDCCAGKKGLCGCRAGKIVCCDGKPSTLPACSCRGDEPEFSP